MAGITHFTKRALLTIIIPGWLDWMLGLLDCWTYPVENMHNWTVGLQATICNTVRSSERNIFHPEVLCLLLGRSFTPKSGLLEQEPTFTTMGIPINANTCTGFIPTVKPGQHYGQALQDRLKGHEVWWCHSLLKTQPLWPDTCITAFANRTTAWMYSHIFHHWLL